MEFVSRRHGCGPPHCLNGGAKALSELIGLTHGHSGCVDGYAHSERKRPREKMARMNGQQVEDAAQREGNQGNLRPNGEEGSAGQEGLELAVRGASAFREDKERHPRAQRFDSTGEARERGARIARVDGNLAGTV